MTKNAQRRTTNELLDHLTCVLCIKGYLTSKVIDSVKEAPCNTTYYDRFGKLTQAHRLIGYKLQRWRHRGLVGGPYLTGCRCLSLRLNVAST
jgi:hypothetical protein